MPNPKLPLRQQLHEVMRFLHYSARTEEAYWGWIVRYLKFHRHPLTPALSAGARPAHTGARAKRNVSPQPSPPKPGVLTPGGSLWRFKK